MPTRLRPFDPADAPAVNALAVTAFEQYREHYSDWSVLSQNLANMAALADHGELVVAEVEGQVIGAVAYIGPGKPKNPFFEPEWPIMRMLVVSPTARGLGVGRLLAQACIDRAVRDKAEVFALHTTPIMEVALAMYQRMGFAFHGEAPPILGVPYGVYLKALDVQANCSTLITFESANQPDVIALIAELDAYQDSLYPPEARYALDLASLTQPNVLFAVARDAAGRAVGCGAVVLGAEFGELKRMFVSPAARGQGLAQRLLALLEAEAVARGCGLLTLESGPFQPEALALYARSGFERCGPFGGYADDPLSVFMNKPIGAAVTAPAADPA